MTINIPDITCDAFGCIEAHPYKHECLGEPRFELGKWPGWVYLDLNRPDIMDRTLRFCGLRCMLHWMLMNSQTSNPVDPLIDQTYIEMLVRRWEKRALR
jgi:hypothetical protein